MNKVIEILKSINYQIPKEILFNYKKINITDTELIIIIYLINQNSSIYNPKQICNDLGFKINEILEIINSLSEKNIIRIDIKKINNIRSEVVNLEPLYEKIVLSLEEKKEDNNSNIYSIFETELGRPISPMECKIIGGWIDYGYSEELVRLALKEAIYNGVRGFRYIDTILNEWGKKGVKTEEDVEKNRKDFKKKNTEKKELFDYDWLNDTENN